ncbi:MAG TPA: GNAT family N-acetyltransferase [Jiangellaceae bacterium]
MTADGHSLSAPDPGVTLRLLGRNDARSVAELLLDTSNESLHQRFFTVPSHSHLRAEIERLTRPASRQHAAVGAEIGGKLVGVASFERDKDDESRAELAILVGDAFQGRGIGRQLVEYLARTARKQQITELTASVLASNERMLRLARSMAASATSQIVDGVIDLTVPLQEPAPNGNRSTVGASTAPATPVSATSNAA